MKNNIIHIGKAAPHRENTVHIGKAAPHRENTVHIGKAAPHRENTVHIGKAAPHRENTVHIGKAAPHRENTVHIGKAAPHRENTVHIGKAEPHLARFYFVLSTIPSSTEYFRSVRGAGFTYKAGVTRECHATKISRDPGAVEEWILDDWDPTDDKNKGPETPIAPRGEEKHYRSPIKLMDCQLMAWSCQVLLIGKDALVPSPGSRNLAERDLSPASSSCTPSVSVIRPVPRVSVSLSCTPSVSVIILYPSVSVIILYPECQCHYPVPRVSVSLSWTPSVSVIILYPECQCHYPVPRGSGALCLDIIREQIRFLLTDEDDDGGGSARRGTHPPRAEEAALSADAVLDLDQLLQILLQHKRRRFIESPPPSHLHIFDAVCGHKTS
ncbi:unnamed protein product [Ranitomeya imitator]|uniref:Uncharacterized protein n=1 Tax=Ranitomeya imitator TaxID=111125 RepID=A0ABN9LHF4_9NEOB|nr:unnamed protein product [Ranitomeya imitator]